MLCRFTVIAFAAPDERISVVGSLPALGAWDVSLAVPLVPVQPPFTKLRPTCWTAVVDINPTSSSSSSGGGGGGADFDYKYVKWTSASGSGPRSNAEECHRVQAASVDLISQFNIPQPSADMYKVYCHCPTKHTAVEWEGTGSGDNRRFIFGSTPAVAGQHDAAVPACCRETVVNKSNVVDKAHMTPPNCEVHYFDKAFNTVKQRGCDVLLPYVQPNTAGDAVERHVEWRPPTTTNTATEISTATTTGSTAASSSSMIVEVYTLQTTPFAGNMSEFDQTTRYYHSVRDANEIDYDKVLDRVYVGSCPRQPEHLRFLKEKLNISTVFNFQAYEDIDHNWPDNARYPDPASRVEPELYKLIQAAGMQYMWLPTTDMDRAAKARTSAKAAWILAGLLANPATTGVYVHCNAGVGRSSACVSGYLINCCGLSVRHANMLMCMRRNMAFYDGVAQAQGFLDYRNLFGEQLQLSLPPPAATTATQA